MKKLISVLLALALCMLGCALAEAADVTGDWYLNVIESQGVQLDPALLGLEMTITLNVDGTAALSAYGEGADMGSWSVNGEQISISDSAGDTMVAELIDGNLVIAEESLDGNLIFGREKTEIKNYVPASVESAPALEDFEGTWNAALIDTMGMQMPMETLGMKLTIEISGTNAVVTSNETGADESYNAPVSLEGDTLNVASMGDEVPMALQLQQDGKLVWAEESDGMTVTMYFEKIA